ncbi:MAG: hypothetical protein ACJ0Q6_02205 [Candidatus Azotimanducaceae bacterium]|nr:hypothetical protein [Gammaproteobacteria bacterium]
MSYAEGLNKMHGPSSGLVRRNRLVLLAATVGLLLIGCSSGESRVNSELAVVQDNIEKLNLALEKNLLRNAILIRQYASILSSKYSELSPLLKELKKDATPEGPLFQGLEKRYQGLKTGRENFQSWTDKLLEAKKLNAATKLDAYNDALSDTVNVIADLSNGELARVNSVSATAEKSINNSKSYGHGGQYMGNPHYGYWSHGAGGSFWAWYGQYALFSTLVGNNRYYYNDWARNRGYSYYHDVGRNHYTSRAQRAGMTDTDNRARRQFGSQGRYQSPYARNRGGAAGLSSSSRGLQTSAFKSQYAKASNYQSSTRTSGYRTSTGLSRGK